MRLTPRGGRDAVDGWALDPGGRSYLKVRVSAPPAEGQANVALASFIARTLKLPRSAVRVAAGQTARLKQLEIEGADEALIAATFGPPPNERPGRP